MSPIVEYYFRLLLQHNFFKIQVGVIRVEAEDFHQEAETVEVEDSRLEAETLGVEGSRLEAVILGVEAGSRRVEAETLGVEADFRQVEAQTLEGMISAGADLIPLAMTISVIIMVIIQSCTQLLVWDLFPAHMADILVHIIQPAILVSQDLM